MHPWMDQTRRVTHQRWMIYYERSRLLIFAPVIPRRPWQFPYPLDPHRDRVVCTYVSKLCCGK